MSAEDIFGPPISVYTREEAQADGVLVSTLDLVPDEPGFAESAGFRAPVSLTAAVAALVTPTAEEADQGQDLKGRLWDVLGMARMYRRGEREWGFPCIFYVAGRPGHRRTHKTFHLKAAIGPGDAGEPVVTILLRTED